MGFLYSQVVQSLPYPTESYAGKTVVVTGSNTGLGKEAARHFARLGARGLILAVRDVAKGEAAKADILASLGKKPKSAIDVWELDMASYASVQAFAARVDGELERVDVFLANAGVARARFAVVEGGGEEMVTVNAVSTLLLAALVMPKLKATAARTGRRPTLTLTTSSLHAHTPFPQRAAPRGGILASVNDAATAGRHWDDQYAVSKLLQVLAVRALAARHDADALPVTVNCVDPGLCRTALHRDAPAWGSWMRDVALARSAEAGSRALVHAAGQGADSHGMYLSDCAVAAPAALVTGPGGLELQDRVWDELATRLDEIRPGVMAGI